MTQKEEEKSSLDMMREMLSSIDLSVMKEQEEHIQSTNERKEYCAAIFAVWPRLEKDIKKLMYEQLMFASQSAESWEAVLVARGTFNGLDLLYELWKTAAGEFEGNASEINEEVPADGL